MRETVDILGVNFDAVDMPKALETIYGFLKDNSGAKSIYTPNPEFIMMAREDNEFKEILNNGDLVIADGVGVVLASKILKKKPLVRVTGFETTKNLLKLGENGSISFYMLCGAPGVAETAAKNLKAEYPNVNIVGTHHGYFTQLEEQSIIEEINRLQPDVLFVGLSAPRQEKWIHRYKNILKAKVCIGVGGTFDIFAGKVKEPPKFIQNMGLWWLYRLITQPTRIKRMMKLPHFGLVVIYNRIFGK